MISRPHPVLLTGLFVLGSVFTALAAQPLPRSTPEAQGISTAGIRAFIEEADAKVDTMHSFMLVRHGKVVAEAWWKPESAEKPHVLYSLSKSFTSTAVGLAVTEGKLSIDDPVLKFFPEDAPVEPSKNLKGMRVRDLLTMSTGHQTEPKFVPDVAWVKTFLAHPVEHKPGAHFLYNSPGSYTLSAIVQKVTGQTVLDFLKPRLFEPLGIDSPEWSTSPQGVNCGGWGLYVRTEDIAKFGQLYLQKGQWNGKQLLPLAWVEQATARQVSNGSDPARDWDQGYGFQFWRCRHGAFRGDGAFGQFCLVLPEQDAVVAITADTKDMQAELNIVWDKLLPAMQAAPLPEDAAEQAKLKEKIATLTVPADHKTNVIALPGSAATVSKVLENESLPSALLKKDKKYSVYLPAGYDTSGQSYPVLYLLHGWGDDATSWAKLGDVRAIADAAIREGKASPMIIVMPDAEKTFYVNAAHGAYPFEDYFFNELIPHIEKTYRCLADKKHRSVAGLSMGGFGSLVYALHHPELFQTCYAMSSAVFDDAEIEKMPLADFRQRFGHIVGEVKEGEPRITDFWNQISILYLVKHLPEDRKKAVRFYVDCGDDDFLSRGNSLLHLAMGEAGIPHEYRVRDGGHSWNYWKVSLPEALTYIAQGLR